MYRYINCVHPCSHREKRESLFGSEAEVHRQTGLRHWTGRIISRASCLSLFSSICGIETMALEDIIFIDFLRRDRYVFILADSVPPRRWYGMLRPRFPQLWRLVNQAPREEVWRAGIEDRARLCNCRAENPVGIPRGVP